MNHFLIWLEAKFAQIPLPFMDVWGRFGYLIGFALMIAAFGGFTFRTNHHWGLGRERQSWDSKSFISVIVTFVLVILTGYLGSFIILVPGAQTFESLKDLSVFLCIVLFGYPALVIVPIAYGISDLIEGVSPHSIIDWLVGYFINPSCFWIAYQFIGKDPDFKKLKTWGWYLAFVAIFSSIEPALWGYICSDEFTSEISFRNITPALFFTTSITWIIAPFAMLLTYPLAKKLRLFGAKTADQNSTERGLPLRIIFAAPFIFLLLIVVSSTALIILQNGERSAKKLVGHLHHEIAENINLQLDDFIESSKLGVSDDIANINLLLKKLTITKLGRAFIIDRSGKLIASSHHSSINAPDEAIQQSILALTLKLPSLAQLSEPLQYRFDYVTAKPLSRNKWLAQATPYMDRHGGHQDWILMTIIPETFYLDGVHNGSSQSAMAFAIFLALSLAIAATIANIVTSPIRQLVKATHAITKGDLSVRSPESNLQEIDALSRSFNEMAEKLNSTYRALESAKESAESSSRIKSEFLDIAAHELRTPMTPMMLLIQLTQKQIKEGKQIIPSNIDLVAQHMTRLTRLVEDLLNASRLERGGLTLNLATADLASLVKECIEDFNKINPLRQFTYRGPDGELLTLIDPIRIHQVLANLLDNAVKYTPENSPIEVRLDANTNEVCVSVIDHGPGIQKENQKDLFSKFYRATSDATLKQPGMGLGLYICRNILSLHRGTIECESESGKGSTFTFVLPRTEPKK